ncbi:MAG: DUF2167 domain-containing protein [Flavobacteriales bacterium]|nr:DUF2167 domain-containing protein [Flavobacteriales bacterium]
MNKLFTICFALFSVMTLQAEEEYNEETIESILLEEQRITDSINGSFTYKIGTIDLQEGLAELNTPNGYKFINAEESEYILTNLWGNPPMEVLGMIFPKNAYPRGEEFSYAVIISYSEEGYIDDEDAKDLDYEELLESMQEDAITDNDQRIQAGYPTVELVGWAAEPYYDEVNKKLYWAKELKFGDSEENTLNYNIRILGRRGYLNLNLIGDLDVLHLVEKDVENILASVEFNQGNTYADFDPEIDEIAAYGIGGLIAGKVLLKVGLLAGLLKFLKVIGLAMVKFWKPIAIGVAALAAGLKKYVFGKKEEGTVEAQPEPEQKISDSVPAEIKEHTNEEVTDNDFEDESKIKG